MGSSSLTRDRTQGTEGTVSATEPPGKSHLSGHFDLLFLTPSFCSFFTSFPLHPSPRLYQVYQVPVPFPAWSSQSRLIFPVSCPLNSRVYFLEIGGIGFQVQGFQPAQKKHPEVQVAPLSPMRSGEWDLTLALMPLLFTKFYAWFLCHLLPSQCPLPELHRLTMHLQVFWIRQLRARWQPDHAFHLSVNEWGWSIKQDRHHSSWNLYASRWSETGGGENRIVSPWT